MERLRRETVYWRGTLMSTRVGTEESLVGLPILSGPNMIFRHLLTTWHFSVDNYWERLWCNVLFLMLWKWSLKIPFERLNLKKAFEWNLSALLGLTFWQNLLKVGLAGSQKSVVPWKHALNYTRPSVSQHLLAEDTWGRWTGNWQQLICHPLWISAPDSREHSNRTFRTSASIFLTVSAISTGFSRSVYASCLGIKFFSSSLMPAFEILMFGIKYVVLQKFSGKVSEAMTIFFFLFFCSQ